jgi:hypothetical protein
MTDQPDNRSSSVSRRSLLRTGAVAGIAALGASKLVLTASPAAGHGTVEWHSEIWNVLTYNQDLNNGAISGPRSYEYQPALYQKLEEWFQFYYWNTPGHYQLGSGGGAQICLNGTHVHEDSGMHSYGRAADISQITLWHAASGFYFDAFNGRYNWWRNSPVMAEYRRRYWAVVAGLTIHFRHVLHYHDNTIHHNHVHVDNTYSNGTYSQFTTGSTTQVKVVQSVCNYIFGLGTSIDGSFGPQTDGHSRTVLSLTGWGGGIRDSQAHWHRFLRAGQRAGHGLPIDSGSMGLSAFDAQASKPLPGGAAR